MERYETKSAFPKALFVAGGTSLAASTPTPRGQGEMTAETMAKLINASCPPSVTADEAVEIGNELGIPAVGSVRGANALLPSCRSAAHKHRTLSADARRALHGYRF